MFTLPLVRLADLGITKDTVLELVQPMVQEGKGTFQFANGAVYVVALSTPSLFCKRSLACWPLPAFLMRLYSRL
jgi:hypothetical protein